MSRTTGDENRNSQNETKQQQQQHHQQHVEIHTASQRNDSNSRHHWPGWRHGKIPNLSGQGICAIGCSIRLFRRPAMFGNQGKQSRPQSLLVVKTHYPYLLLPCILEGTWHWH